MFRYADVMGAEQATRRRGRRRDEQRWDTLNVNSTSHDETTIDHRNR